MSRPESVFYLRNVSQRVAKASVASKRYAAEQSTVEFEIVLSAKNGLSVHKNGIVVP